MTEKCVKGVTHFSMSRRLAWRQRFESDSRRFRHQRSSDVVARASRVDLLSLLNLSKVAPQGIKLELDSTKSEMVRNGRYRHDQINAAGGVHTTAADEPCFSTGVLVCSSETRHQRFLQRLKLVGASMTTMRSKPLRV